MSILDPRLTPLLTVVADHLDVPRSYYEKASARHRSLSEWLQRDGSTLADFDPHISPQGSFRYGTVNQPVRDGESYDLDNVCVLRKLTKGILTQQQLKDLFGAEIRAYAKAKGMSAPVEEHNRCWRLVYADEAEFHLDSLPCVPEDAERIAQLVRIGVPLDLARKAVAITDRRHRHYREVTALWLSSNPRGFADWFESRAALGRSLSFVEKARASIEPVPAYEWKTTLQRSIQLLKRHRDVMFVENPDCAPISMIITNLAGHAYEGETDLATALAAIVERMPRFVQPDVPGKARVPNPADPFEDYADKWRTKPRLQLEANFWNWHESVRADLQKLGGALDGDRLTDDIEKLFAVTLTDDEVGRLQGRRMVPATPTRTGPTLIVPSAPRPWGKDA